MSYKVKLLKEICIFDNNGCTEESVFLYKNIELEDIPMLETSLLLPDKESFFIKGIAKETKLGGLYILFSRKEVSRYKHISVFNEVVEGYTLNGWRKLIGYHYGF